MMIISQGWLIVFFFFCHSDTFPIKYLGLPLGANPCRLSTKKPVISNIMSRLA